MQQTISKPATFEGITLHAGTDVCATVLPAPVGHGIVFKRMDVDADKSMIPAQWDMAEESQLCTKLVNAHGVSVSTIEHLMAALHGLHIDNVLVEMSGPEVPILDGSSQEFVEALEAAGIERQNEDRKMLRILKRVEVKDGDKVAAFEPSTIPSYSLEIDFEDPAIARQKYGVQLVNGYFKHDLASARTFGFKEQVEALQGMGLILGGSLDNAIVVDRGTILNEEGLRFDNEFVRHKLLDAIGDLALAGAPIQGAYVAYKSGHALNNRLLQALFADPSAYEFV